MHGQGRKLMKARVAVVGLGKMGLMHSSILGTLDNVELAALCEKKSILRRFASKIIPAIPIVADVENLAGLKLDAVYITTPESSHYPIIKTIYEKGIARNVFSEKPLTTSYSKSKELCELAKRAGGVNVVGYNRRYSVTFGKAKRVLEEGILGELASFDGHAFSADFLGATLDATSARGALSDLGCHVIDLAFWLFGPLEVTNKPLDAPNNSMPRDWSSIKVKSSGKYKALTGELQISRSMKDYRLPEMSLEIKGSKGTMKVDEDKVTLKTGKDEASVFLKHDLGDNVPFFIGGTEYIRENMRFIDSVLNGSAVEPDFQAASRIEAIIEQVTNVSKEPQAI
jgi:predicted dehydrogenase